MPTAPYRFYKGRGVMPAVEPSKAYSKPVTLPPSVSYLAGTVLGEVIGTDDVWTVTVTGTPTGGTFTLTVGGQTTAAIAYNATAAVVQAALEALSKFGNASVQTVTLSGTPTGGVFNISAFGETTTPLAYNASAAAVQTALQNLGGIGTGNVTVTGSAGGPYTLTFAGALANAYIQQLGADAHGIVPLGTTATVAVLATGGSAGGQVNVTGGPMPGAGVVITFQNDAGKAPQTLTINIASLTGGAPACAPVHTVTGAAPSAVGLHQAVVGTAIDGSQNPRAILQFDCTTDAAGNITMGLQVGGDSTHGATYQNVPAWYKGIFNVDDCVGLTDALIASFGRMISGSISSDGMFEIY